MVATVLGIAGAYPVKRRIEFDRQNNKLLLVADSSGFRTVSRALGVDDDTLLKDLSSSGLSAVAVRPTSAAQLLAEGHLVLAPGSRPGHTRLQVPFPDPYSIASTCSTLFPGTVLKGNILEIPSSGALFQGTALFFDHEWIRRIRRSGMDVIYRLPNSPWAGSPYIGSLVQAIPTGATVIFDNKSVLGWPGNIDLVASFFSARDIRIGMVEFSGQKGVHQLLSKGNLRSIAIHSIPPKEMSRLDHRRLMPRWLRAADERNIRMLYVQPIPPQQMAVSNSRGRDLYRTNLAYLGELKDAMTAAGYELDEPLAARQFLEVNVTSRAGATSRTLATLSAACLVAAVLGMLEFLPGLMLPFLMLPITILLFFSVKLAALAAAVAAPAISAMLFQFRTRQGAGFFRISFELVLLFAINLLGGSLIFELLSHPDFVLHRAGFSGVKLVYLAPLVLVCLDVIRRQRIPILSTRPTFLDLCLLAVIAAGGMIYVMRSGNFSIIPASSAEHQLRDSLEQKLPARPRTKEVLIGYPALILLAFLGPGRNWRIRLLLTGAGAIAPVSIANAFCHLHTPFLATVLREATGLAGGLLVLLLLIPFRRGFSLLSAAPCASISGYFGYGNCGDELILRNQVSTLKEACGDEATVLLFNRRVDPALEKSLGIRTANRWSPIQLLAGMVLSPVHVSSGGGVFQDSTGWRTVPYYLLYPAISRLSGAPYLGFVGQSYGSISRSVFRKLVAWYASRANLVQPRDTASAKNLRRWGLSGTSDGTGLQSTMEVGTDLLFWDTPAIPPMRQEASSIGLNIRPVPSLARSNVVKLVEGVRQVAASRSLKVRFLAFHSELDRPFLKGLAEENEIVDVGPDDLAQVFPDLKALVGMRYHAMLLAACAGTPLLAVSYDGKTDHFLAESGHPHNLDRSSIDAATVQKTLEAVLEGSSVDRLRSWTEREACRGREARQAFIKSIRDRHSRGNS